MSALIMREVAFKQDWKTDRLIHCFSIVWERRRGDHDADCKTRLEIKLKRRAVENGPKEIRPLGTL